MRRCLVGIALLTVVGMLLCGCQGQEASQPTEPVGPVTTSVPVTPPGEKTFQDVEGVRRVAVALPWESQPNGRKVGQDFVNAAGQAVLVETSPALDEVVQHTVASAFKQLGFNVTLAPAIAMTGETDLGTELERYQSDYLTVVKIGQFLFQAGTAPGTPVFGGATMQVEVYNKDGLVTVIPVQVTGGWQTTGRATTDDFRKDAEALLEQVRQQMVANAVLRQAMGLPASP